MFVRFVEGEMGADPAALDGVFTAAYRLRAEYEEAVAEHYYLPLDDTEADTLNELLGWFETQLLVPPFNRRCFPVTAVCWYFDDARSHVRQMWALVALLRQKGVRVRKLRANRVGLVYYEDDFQVVADKHCISRLGLRYSHVGEVRCRQPRVFGQHVDFAAA
jgi:hypothetical protein